MALAVAVTSGLALALGLAVALLTSALVIRLCRQRTGELPLSDEKGSNELR